MRSFTRVHDASVSSLALGKAGRAAIVSGSQALLFDREAWKPIPPAFDDPAALNVEIYFGRDNEPRLMGFVGPASPESRQRYLRRRQGQWREARDEIGQLGGVPGPMYGVLGYDDPEVVCVAKRSCIVKRITGWKTVAAHDEPARVLLSGGRAWALHPTRIEELTPEGWQELQPARAWTEPDGLWLGPGGEPWVVEGKRDTIVKRSAGRWEEMRSPLRGPRSLWGNAPNDLWLVGDGGAAHFDGSAWHCVRDVSVPLDQIASARGEVWFAGQGGVWRSRRP